MNKTLINTIAAAVLLLLSATAAQAAVGPWSIWLEPMLQEAQVGGDPVQMDLWMDFTGDATIGGGVDVTYNHAMLGFVSWTLNEALGSDASFTRDPVEGMGLLDGIGFGNFGGLGGGGQTLVGTLQFVTLGTTGLALVDLAEDAGGAAGEFYSASSYNLQSPGFVGAEVIINAVPLPAAVWMLLGGLGILGVGSRRKSATA